MSLELTLIISLFVLLGLIAFLLVRFVQTKRAALSEEQALKLIARELQATMKELSLQFTRALEEERRLTSQRIEGVVRTVDALKDGLRELASLADQRFGEFGRSVERHIATLRDTQQSMLVALAKFTEATEKRLTEDRAATAAELDRVSAALVEGLTQFAAAMERAFAEERERAVKAAQRAEEANRALLKEFLGALEKRSVPAQPVVPPPVPSFAPLASALEQRFARDRAARAEAWARRPAPDSGREAFELLAKQPQSAGPFTVEMGAASLTRQVMSSIAAKTVTPVEPATQKRPATMDDVLHPSEPVRRTETVPYHAPAGTDSSLAASGRSGGTRLASVTPARSSSAAPTVVQQPTPPSAAVVSTTTARSQEPAPPVQKPSVSSTPAVPASAAATVSPAVAAVKPVSQPVADIRPSPVPAPPPAAPVNREASRETFTMLVARYTEEWREERKRRPATILNAKQIIGRLADELTAFKNTYAAALEPSFIGKVGLVINDAAGLRGFSAATSGAFQEFWKRGDALINELRKLEKLV